MRKMMVAAVAAALLTVAGSGAAQAGCYRLGLSGYHWYRSCVGPRIMYPHHRYCSWRHGYRHCWYH
jgi:hypothetical protein